MWGYQTWLFSYDSNAYALVVVLRSFVHFHIDVERTIKILQQIMLGIFL